MRVTALAMLISTAAAAATDARDDDRERRDAMRRAVESGDAMPLSQILPKLRGRIAGDVTGVDVERQRGHWRYEFRIIGRDGRVRDVYVDARSGEIEGIEEK
ncbi:PepSY domain-containing protein [Bradyrhizobium ontarionense]|uniref:PepSY domain-containing protein n=1 Tax=Bradyrhizobium ontarionense TaxID=2898149 RepID=A0ABY3RAR7_9BRAD|nr:PepSY domain-containing protein [Bradyrhizobium sp. A19]UFZ04475.1 PepSY domain-containing protein [Bradyrhizobium sp. A19]